MPIYRAEFEGEVMIYVPEGGEEPDHYTIRDAIREEISGLGGGVDGLSLGWASRVSDPRALGDWADSRPYERDDDMTCAQIMEMEAEAAKKRPPTIEEIEAAGQQRLIV